MKTPHVVNMTKCCHSIIYFCQIRVQRIILSTYIQRQCYIIFNLLIYVIHRLWLHSNLLKDIERDNEIRFTDYLDM